MYEHEWVEKTIEWTKAAPRHGIAYNTELKEYVESIHPWKHHGNWRDVNKFLKDDPLEEELPEKYRLAFIPVGKHWEVSPVWPKAAMWVRETLGRNKAEFTRMIRVLGLPKYMPFAMAKEYRGELEDIRNMIDGLLKKMDEDPPE